MGQLGSPISKEKSTLPVSWNPPSVTKNQHFQQKIITSNKNKRDEKKLFNAKISIISYSRPVKQWKNTKISLTEKLEIDIIFTSAQSHVTLLTKFSKKKWQWIFVGLAENLRKKIKSESDGMSKIPITEQCITDCSMLNQTTCLPASPKPATIINYHLVSFPWSWILINCELIIIFWFGIAFPFTYWIWIHTYLRLFEPFSDLKKAFHIKSVDILEIIWKGFVNWFLLSSL